MEQKKLLQKKSWKKAITNQSEKASNDCLLGLLY